MSAAYLIAQLKVTNSENYKEYIEKVPEIVKKYGGETVVPGNIIVRQRGTKIFPGENVGMGKDHSIFSVVKGKVVFKKSKADRTFVSVKPN